MEKRIALLLVTAVTVAVSTVFGQIDPIHRNLLELGYDQPLMGHGPQALYAYYYYNNPAFVNTNMALRLAIAPAYFDSEIGFRHLLSPTTDVGIGVFGGGFADNYYEIRQGHYFKGQSFDGHGGGTSLNVYQLLNPGMLIPINLIASGGYRYSTYTRDGTDHSFDLPADQSKLFVRTGLRVAGKEPMLYPDLGFELSFWFERQWSLNNDRYGFNDDRRINPAVNLYWAYVGLNYAWTNIGHRISAAVTVGGSDDADRFSAWRLGGVLPLGAEFPLILPGYYYEELTAKKFIHLYAAYTVPLDTSHRWEFRVEGAAAKLQYLPGFEQREDWQTGAGCGLIFSPKSQICRVVLRYGYGFNAIRHGEEGAHSVGLLFQFDFERRKETAEDAHGWRRFLPHGNSEDTPKLK